MLTFWLLADKSTDNNNDLARTTNPASKIRAITDIPLIAVNTYMYIHATTS